MIKKLFPLVLLALIFAVGTWARIRFHGEIPLPGDNMDEYSNAWVGQSLIRIGMPVGNSWLPGYEKYDDRYINADRVFSTTENTSQQIIYPWLDHPPLLSLITGGYAYSKGLTNFEDISVLVIRKPIVILSSLNILLIAILTYLLFGTFVALLAASFYAFSPYLIVAGRIVQGENGYLPFYFLTLISLVLFQKRSNLRWLVLAGIFAGTATLFKLSAVGIIIAGSVLLFITNNKWRFQSLFTFLFISLSITFLYVIYSLALDPKLFLTVTFSNANRYYGIGTQALYQLFNLTQITGKSLTDGWLLAGLLAVFSLLTRANRFQVKFITVPFVSQLAVYIFFGSFPYGWYTFPLWPFTTIALAYVIGNGFKKTSRLLHCLLLLLIPLGVNLSKIYTAVQFTPYATLWRIVLFVGLLVSLFYLILPTKKRYKKLPAIILSVVLAATLLASLYRFKLIDVSTWYSIT